jgi:hypothetical protein
MRPISCLAKVTTAAVIAAVSSIAAAQQNDELATLDTVEGETMVSKGARYVNGAEGMRLVDGQRVMAVKEDAVIQYDDGCRYVLEEGKLLLIEDKSPCVLGIVPATTSLAWIPPAFAGLVAVAAALDTGSDGGDVPVRQPISP